MANKEYNGWTNYETWRINLEIFDGLTPEDITGGSEVTQSELSEYVDMILDESPDLAKSYADAFTNEVNYYEIAEHLNEEYKKGGNTKKKSKRSINTDRRRSSKEPHEQAYKSKRKGKYYSKGGILSWTGSFFDIFK
jgi:hypothetical protein